MFRPDIALIYNSIPDKSKRGTFSYEQFLGTAFAIYGHRSDWPQIQKYILKLTV